MENHSDDPWLRRLYEVGRAAAEAGDGAADDRAADEDGSAASAPGEGLLRLKLGYNPNSSSVGSVVTTLLWGATATAAVLNIAGALLRSRLQSVVIVGAGADDANPFPQSDHEPAGDGPVEGHDNGVSRS